MSNFDNIFDYGNVKNFYNGKIASYQNDIQNANIELATFANASPEFQIIANSNVTFLQNLKMCRIESINRIGNVISEINVIENLPSDSKNVFCQFYETCIEPFHIETKRTWMRHLIMNTSDLIGPMGNILANIESKSNTEIMCLTDAVLRKYPVKRCTAGFVQVKIV